MARQFLVTSKHFPARCHCTLIGFLSCMNRHKCQFMNRFHNNCTQSVKWFEIKEKNIIDYLLAMDRSAFLFIMHFIIAKYQTLFFERKHEIILVLSWERFLRRLCEEWRSRVRVYKTFFMLNSAEHEIFPANKIQITNICIFFFLAKHSWAWKFLYKYENANYCWRFHIH